MSPPLVVIGNVNVDLVMGPQAPWPAPGTEVVLPESELRAGGAAGNTALAWQGLGAPFRLVANTSADGLGRWLAEAFGPAAAAWPVSPRPCGLSVGLAHPDGERTFFTALGHLLDLDLDDVVGQLPPSAAPGGLALLTGCFVTPALLPRTAALMDLLGKRGYAVALDPGWPSEGWSADNRARVLSWLPACAHLLVNEAEALGLTGTGSLDAAGEVLGARLASGAVLVIKAGADGARARRGDRTVHCPAPPVAVVDTVGAGDAFNAGYLFASWRGLPWPDAVRAGVETASHAVATRPRRYRAGA